MEKKESINGVRLIFSRQEMDCLRSLPERLLLYLDSFDVTNPVVQRLFPPASGDEELNREFVILAGEEIRNRKKESIEVFAASLDKATDKKSKHLLLLDEHTFESWLLFLNDMRLMLGTELAIQDDHYLQQISPEDFYDERKYLYAYLSHVQGELLG